MAPRITFQRPEEDQRLQANASAKAIPALKLGFNVDAAAIVIALTLAALIRLDVLPRIGW